MRSTRIKIGVAVAASGLLALMLTALATGAGAAGAGRLGHGVRHEVRLRQGHRQEGDRQRRSSSAGSTC